MPSVWKRITLKITDDSGYTFFSQQRIALFSLKQIMTTVPLMWPVSEWTLF